MGKIVVNLNANIDINYRSIRSSNKRGGDSLKVVDEGNYYFSQLSGNFIIVYDNLV